jgi:putative ABC transport system permease protein
VTLFSIVKKNIRGNFRNYSLYFITMIISIIIYYTFSSLQNSSQIKEILENSGAMQSTFLMSSVILILFVGIFILYSNSFFTRKRKKEVGLYAMVGIPKRTIGRMLFYENLVMGVLSLIVGILLGALLSKLFFMILVKLIGVEVNIGLGIAPGAVLNTIIVFAIIILFTSIQGYRLIYRFKLIELFHADNTGEKRIKSSPIIAFLAVLILIGSFLIANQALPRGNENILRHTGLILFGLIAGTYLFFQSTVSFLLKIMQSNKRFHYRGTNMIGTSQLLYRIKGNTHSFTVIALLSALTISFFGAMFEQYDTFESRSLTIVPFSYTHLSKGTAYDEAVSQIIHKDKQHPLIAQIDIPVLEVSTDYTAPDHYTATPLKVISASTFNAAAKILYPDLSVKITNQEAVAIQPALTNQSPSDYIGSNITLELPDQNLTLTFSGLVKERILTWAYPDFYIIVNDDVFQELAKDTKTLLYKAYEVEKEQDTKQTTEKLMAMNSEEANVFSRDKDTTQIFAYYMIYQENLEKSALNIFVVGFLGLIFLAATGSILHFKQLTEATESRQNYEILRKIGVTKKEILYTVAKQNLFIFILPFILGITNSIILLNFLSKFLSDLIGLDIGSMLLLSTSAFFVIYLGYYILTVRTYNRIVNDVM